MTLQAGELAPDFTLPDQQGKKHRLSDYKGKWILLYFYPKDDTPGCTKEACALRDNWGEYEKLDMVILGVSVDSTKSHAKFAQKYQLPFSLLADEAKEVVHLYQVWGKKKFMGREYEGTHRMSFLINPEGKIVKVYEKVEPAAHAAEVLHDRNQWTN